MSAFDELIVVAGRATVFILTCEQLGAWVNSVRGRVYYNPVLKDDKNNKALLKPASQFCVKDINGEGINLEPMVELAKLTEI